MNPDTNPLQGFAAAKTLYISDSVDKRKHFDLYCKVSSCPVAKSLHFLNQVRNAVGTGLNIDHNPSISDAVFKWSRYRDAEE